MKFTKLEEEQRQFFDDNGYLIVHNALSSNMLERVTAACDRVVDEKFEAASSRRASLINVLPEDPVFRSLVTCETTVPLVVQLLSFNLRLSKSHLIYNFPDPPDAKPSTHWHRDFMESPFDLGPHRYPRLMIKIVYQLSDTTPLSGNTLLVPGSNNLSGPLKIPEGRNDPENTVELQLRAGDAFLFESRSYHRIGLNRTTQPRKCLMMGYSYGWISPLDYDVQPDWLLEEVTDPIARQLIGGAKSHSTEIDPTALRDWAEEHGVQRSSEIDYAKLADGSDFKDYMEVAGDTAERYRGYFN